MGFAINRSGFRMDPLLMTPTLKVSLEVGSFCIYASPSQETVFLEGLFSCPHGEPLP